MIDSNEQLQKFTDNNLLRLIETADSTPKAVEKVREILSHYNRQVKGNSVITFPIRDLISMVKNKGSVAAICLDGLNQASFPKLLTAALNFLLNVIEKMPTAAQKNFSTLLFERVQKVREEVKDGVAISLLYRCIGILGKREPSILAGRVESIASAFRSIAQAPDDVGYAIVDCLTQWLDGVRKLTDHSVTNNVKDLIQEFVTHDNAKCRLIALKYMESLLTSSEMDLRWVLLQACGDSRDEIRNEAVRLIDVSLKVNVSVDVAISYLWDRLNISCSRYLWAILARAVGIPVDIKTMDSGHEFIHIAPKITRLLSESSVVFQERVTKISLYALKDAHDVSLFHIATCFSAIRLPISPPVSIISTCVQRCRTTSRSELANVAAHLAMSLMSDKERNEWLLSTLSALEKPNFTAGDCWLASASIASHASPRSTTLSVINQLVNIAEDEYNKTTSVLESALGALANILRAIVLHDKDFVLPSDAVEHVLVVCEKIALSRKNAISPKAHEEAARTIGFAATVLNAELFDQLTSTLYAIGCGPPQPELQLVVGAALYDVALGPYSSSRRNVYLSSEDEIQASSVQGYFMDYWKKSSPPSLLAWLKTVKYNSFWGAALGLAAGLEESHSELDPFLCQLVPKLFRYRYDPDQGVKQPMCAVWSALIKSRPNLVSVPADSIIVLTQVEEFVDDIASELKQQLSCQEWRVRESAVSLLLDLTKTVKSNIQPFLGELIPALLDTISDTEPEVLNYVAARSSLAELEVVGAESFQNQYVIFRSSEELRVFKKHLHLQVFGSQSNNQSNDLVHQGFSFSISIGSRSLQLDDARAQIARTSPMMNAVHDLIPQIDGSILLVLQPRLCEQLRSSVGSSTRSSCAQFLVLLALRQPQLLRDYPAQCGKVTKAVEKYRMFLCYFVIDKIFTALMSGIHDRNPSLRKSFASAISYMAKYATSSSLERLMSAVLKNLMGEDESMKQSAKQILKSLSTNSAELLQNYSKLIIPYVFLETCQPVTRGDETSRKRNEEWCELWSEIVPTTLLSNLIPMMPGRIWTGKEHLISAISVVISYAGQFLRQHWTETNLEELFLSLTKEASKGKKQYAAAGLLACAVFARSLSYSKAADWLFEKVDENMRKVTSDQSDQSEDEEIDSFTKDATLSEFICQNMIAIAKAAGAYSGGQRALSAIDSFCSYLKSTELPWKAKQALVSALSDLIDSWQLDPVLETTKLVDALLTMAEQMIVQQRKSLATQNLGVVSKLASRGDIYAIKWSEIKAKWEINEFIREIGLFEDLVALNMNVNNRGEASRTHRSGEDGDFFANDEEDHDADQDSLLSDEEYGTRKKRSKIRSTRTVSTPSRIAALGLGQSRTPDITCCDATFHMVFIRRKARTLSESSEEEWLCKPRLNGKAKTMESAFVDTPVKKRSRKAVILSDDSEDENEDHPSSVAALTKAACEGTKRDRKRKIFSGNKGCVDGDEKGSESGDESDASDESD
ncbi:unnamed protein product, partial [Angiostrongylus costaricensis]|uniref:Integrator complex subunit 7 n=1 Tax=Angiostrongylus costaricensis TaxID=334426 RepID=A0A158PGD3_ANGCS